MAPEQLRSKRCSTCGINFPPRVDDLCLVCGGNLWNSYRNHPDEDWLLEVESKLRGLGTVPATYQHPPNGRCQVYESQGHYFLRHEDLLRLGYLYLEDGSIVYANDTFYELDGYAKSTGYWLVEVVEVEDAADELHPAMFELTGGAGGPDA